MAEGGTKSSMQGCGTAATQIQSEQPRPQLAYTGAAER
jgi:hypothetical protein